jgi:retron-type reverse transcriptase
VFPVSEGASPTGSWKTENRIQNSGVRTTLASDFSNHSYGFRPERSAHDAVRAAQEHVKAGKGWVVDIDLKAFFDQVNHDKLMNLVGRKIRDKTILKLIGKYLRAPMQRAGKKEARDKGTPQGGPLMVDSYVRNHRRHFLSLSHSDSCFLFSVFCSPLQRLSRNFRILQLLNSCNS